MNYKKHGFGQAFDHVECKQFYDSRGFFMEAWKKSAVGGWDWKQMNVSYSKEGVVRGLHYRAKKPEAKLVFCLSGQIQGLAVCLECGEVAHYGFMLPNGMGTIIRPGWAHGFRAVQDSIVCYLVSEEYDHDDAYGINPLDKELDIPWKSYDGLILSDQDKAWPNFKDR